MNSCHNTVIRCPSPANVALYGLVLALVIATSAHSAPAIDIGAPVELLRSTNDTRDPVMPAVAFDGQKTFLVVWQQGRDYYQSQTTDILCARVNTDGTLVDAEPVTICKATDSQMRPRVAYAGGVFLVVWEDLRGGEQFDVYAARVSADEKAIHVLDPDGFLIAGGANSQSRPDVAPGEGGFLVAWQEFRPAEGNRLLVSRVTIEGEVTDERGVHIATSKDTARGGNVSLVQTDHGWFVFWRMAVAGVKGGVARLAEQDGKLVTEEINGPLPNYSGVMGRAASDGRHVLYAGSSISGRGWAFRPCTGLLFHADRVQPLPNPNTPIRQGSSGWRTDQMFCLHVPMPGVDGPVATAFAGGVYLVAAKGSNREKPPYRDRLFIVRVSPEGKRLDDAKQWQWIEDGERPAANPALCAGQSGSALIVYESDNGTDKATLVARKVSVK